MNRDLITDLPDEVTDRILSRLSIKDAIKTSVLSSKWRYKRTSISCIAFEYLTVKSEWDVLNHILTLHRGPIEKFHVCLPERHTMNTIDRWILRLSRSSVKDISLCFHYCRKYIVPKHLYSCQSLTTLALRNCRLDVEPLPLTFKGFKYLKSLDLYCVVVDQDALEKLISTCPVLERLSLMYVETTRLNSLSDLKISAPNLRRFCGFLNCNFIFENTFCLAEVTVSRDDKKKDHSNSYNFLKFFHDLPHIRKLDIKGSCIEHLSDGIEPGNLPELCSELDYLTIDMNFNDEKSSLTTLAILTIAPNLKKLKVRSVRRWSRQNVGPPRDFWEDHRFNNVFAKVNHVEVDDISGTKQELDFIKFVLSNSPVLKGFVYSVFHAHKQPELIKEKVLSLRHA